MDDNDNVEQLVMIWWIQTRHIHSNKKTKKKNMNWRGIELESIDLIL